MAGTLRELPKSKRTGERRWELRVYVGRDPAKTVRDPETGRVLKQGPPIHRSQVFTGGKRDADRALERFVQDVRDTEAHSAVGTAATLGRLLDEWLTKIVDRHRARATQETYRVHVDKYIRPALGSTRLAKLTAYDIDTYLEKLAADGLSPATVKLDHSILSAALTQGVRWKWIPSNPARDATLPSIEKSDAPALSAKQLAALLAAAVQEDADMAMVIALGALTGCRRGELCGLQWGDVDWERQRLTVAREWVPGKGGQYLKAATKTKKARTVFVGAGGKALLERYRATKVDLLGHDPAPDGWLLSYDGGATPMRAKSLTYYVADLGRRLKVPIHFHSLRHFAATELHAAGVDMATAAAQLGHSPAVMAGTYLHASDDRGARAGEVLGAVVSGALPSAQADDTPRG